MIFYDCPERRNTACKGRFVERCHKKTNVSASESGVIRIRREEKAFTACQVENLCAPVVVVSRLPVLVGRGTAEHDTASEDSSLSAIVRSDLLLGVIYEDVILLRAAGWLLLGGLR